ncbi:MAG: hypothetical protein GY772_18150, partial [bacterium]|nr:hypothetical protein [bacterium]
MKGGGWVAATLPQQSTNPFENDDDDAESCEDDGETDPIREQISNVEGMVREAEREGREDEARSLRDNLNLLRTEHK